MQQTQTTTEPQSEKTGGEKLFTALDYYGLGWLANAAVGVASTELAFNHTGNPLSFAKDKVVGAALGLSNKIFHNESLETLTKTIGEKLAEGNISGLSEQTAGILTGSLSEELKQHRGKYKEAFYDLYEKTGGYQGIADKLGLQADEIKQATNHMIKKQAGNDFFNTVAVLGTLCIGGFVVMIPMKIMEDNKRIITEYLDNKVIDPVNSLIGKAPKTDEEKQALQQKRSERYAEIEQEPHQTWGSMLTSRVVALIPLYALHMAWWNENNAIKYAGGLATGAELTNPSPEYGFGGVGYYSKNFGRALGDGIYDKALPNVAKSAMTKEWFSEKVDWATMDVLYSLVAATTTLHFTKIFGKMFDKSYHEPNEELSEPSAKIAKIEHVGALHNNDKSLQLAF